jgi:hypothetical protein
MAVRPSDGLPRPFSGEGNKNPLAHWYAFENYLKIQNHPDRDFLDAFKLTVSDAALILVVDDTDNLTSKAVLKARFLDRFSGQLTRQGKANEFRNLRLAPGETVGTYASKIKSLGDRLGMTEALMLDQFYWGLPAQIRMGVLMHSPDTWSLAVEQAEKLMELSPQVAKEVSFACQENKSKFEELKEMIMALKLGKDGAVGGDVQPEQSRERSPYPREDRYRKDSKDRNSRDFSRDRKDRDYSRERRDRDYSTDRSDRFRRDSRDRFQRGFSKDRRDRNYSRDRYQSRDYSR